MFSSRKLERASHDSVAFRFIAANQHPDHDTIAAFRRRFLKEIEKLSYEHAGKIEAQLQAEAAELMAKAEATDQAAVPDGMSIPEELARREARLAEIARARAAIEARAKERLAREQAEYEAKMAAREAKAAAPGGRPPAPPADGAGPTDQVNLTDEESRIMPDAGWRLRAVLQCPGGGGGGQPVGGRLRCGTGDQRQAAGRADAGQARRVAG